MEMAYKKDRKNYFRIISVEIPIVMNQMIMEYCKAKDFTKSELIRVALKEYFKNHEFWG